MLDCHALRRVLDPHGAVTSDGLSLARLERTLDPNGSRDEDSSLAKVLTTPSLPDWARHAVPSLHAVAFRDGSTIKWDEERNTRHFAPGGPTVAFEFAPRRVLRGTRGRNGSTFAGSTIWRLVDADVEEAEDLARRGGINVGRWGGLKLTAGMPLPLSPASGVAATATRRDGEELLITTIDKHGAVRLAAPAAEERLG